MKEQWINDLQRKMSDFEQSAPEGLWDSIEAAMDDAGTTTESPKQRHNRKPTIIWLPGIGAAAAVLAFVLLNGDNANIAPLQNTPASIIANSTPHHSQIISETSSAESQSSAHQAPRRITAGELLAETHTIKNTDAATPAAIDTIANASHPAVSVAAPADSIAKDPTKNAAENTTQKATERPQTSRHGNSGTSSQSLTLAANMNTRHHSNNRLSASIFASNLPASSKAHAGYGGLIYSAQPWDQSQSDGFMAPDAKNDVVLSNNPQEAISHKEHRLPIKFGATVRYAINDRWGIESGLVYTLLSSHLTSGTEYNLYDVEQQVQFLGIPVNASYNIWQNDRWNVYATAGGMIEKCVWGKSTTDYILNGKVSSTNEESVMIDPLQFSLNAAAGVQVNIIPQLGLYVEPGLSYYIDNNSSVSTIYSDRPLNFSLKFGLRLTLK